MESNDRDHRLAQQINTYLNHYVLVIDAKAVAIATTSFVALGFVLSEDSLVQFKAASCLSLVAVASLVFAVGFALTCVFPRTPSSGRGHIFWADIASYGSTLEYWKSIKELSEEDVTIELARQNYNVSKVLMKKALLVRASIVALGVALAAQLLSFVVK